VSSKTDIVMVIDMGDGRGNVRTTAKIGMVLDVGDC